MHLQEILQIFSILLYINLCNKNPQIITTVSKQIQALPIIIHFNNS